MNGKKLGRVRHLLHHGDEVSLGHVGTAEGHDVRYIFRSVGCKSGPKDDDQGKAGEVYERYQILRT